MNKHISISLILCGFINLLLGQNEKVSECLELIKLSESTYIHTCSQNNGLVYINNGEAVIISTPDSDKETQHLIDWVKSKAKIVGYVIDRWHPDAMEGLDIVHKNNITSYSSERTQQIAKEKGLPVTNFGFEEKLELDLGKQKVVCHYLGEAHTSDGIVVWIPDEKILFGGNEIRNNGGWIGNIADANLSEWSNTAKRVKENYANAKIVVPGHGKYGGSELIDYTINLYSFPKDIECKLDYSSDSLIKESIEDFQFLATAKKSHADSIIYSNAKVSFSKKGKEIELYSESIEYTHSNRTIYVPSGCISIKDHHKVESFSFNKLYVNLREDEVELTMVIKGVK